MAQEPGKPETNPSHHGSRRPPPRPPKAGNVKEPMSMARPTGSRSPVDMQRTMPACRDIRRPPPDRHRRYRQGAHWRVSGNAPGHEDGIVQKETNRGSDGHGSAGRAARTPILHDDMRYISEVIRPGPNRLAGFRTSFRKPHRPPSCRPGRYRQYQSFMSQRASNGRSAPPNG